MSAMPLSVLLDNPSLASLDQLAWRGLACDSRKVEAGDVFVALRGERVDGRDYIEDSLARGAVAVLVEHEQDALLNRNQAVPQIGVRDLGKRLGVFRSEEHTSELQSRPHLVCRLLLEKKKTERQPSTPWLRSRSEERSRPGGPYTHPRNSNVSSSSLSCSY